MKRIVFSITVLIFICSANNISAQKSIKIRSIYLATQPVDFGIGQRIDIGFKNDALQLYESLTYGDWGLYKQNGLRHHLKASIGIMAPIYQRYNQTVLNHNEFFVTGAVNYHHLGKATINNEIVDPRIFNPWSFEIGITGYTWSRFAIGVRTDILRWEPCIDFGYKF